MSDRPRANGALPQPATAQSIRADGPATYSDASVLVVDDDPIIRQLIATKLAGIVGRTLEAADGSDAWTIIREQNVAIAFVDIEMPNIDGLTLIRCIRNHPTTRHLPIVVVTSREDGGTLRDALAAGATSYLTKPLTWSTFSFHVTHLLEMADAQKRAIAATDHAQSALAALSALSGEIEQVSGELKECFEIATALQRATQRGEQPRWTEQALRTIATALLHQRDVLASVKTTADTSANALKSVGSATIQPKDAA